MGKGGEEWRKKYFRYTPIRGQCTKVALVRHVWEIVTPLSRHWHTGYIQLSARRVQRSKKWRSRKKSNLHYEDISLKHFWNFVGRMIFFRVFWWILKFFFSFVWMWKIKTGLGIRKLKKHWVGFCRTLEHQAVFCFFEWSFNIVEGDKNDKSINFEVELTNYGLKTGMLKSGCWITIVANYMWRV